MTEALRLAQDEFKLYKLETASSKYLNHQEDKIDAEYYYDLVTLACLSLYFAIFVFLVMQACLRSIRKFLNKHSFMKICRMYFLENIERISLDEDDDDDEDESSESELDSLGSLFDDVEIDVVDMKNLDEMSDLYARYCCAVKSASLSNLPDCQSFIRLVKNKKYTLKKNF